MLHNFKHVTGSGEAVVVCYGQSEALWPEGIPGISQGIAEAVGVGDLGGL